MWLIRRRTVFVAATALLLLCAAVLALSHLGVNRYRGEVQAKLAERLQRDVSIGSMRVSFLPLRLRVEKAVIGEDPRFPTGRPFARSEEHTSELQSQSNLVCRLLLEKKKKKNKNNIKHS